MARARYHPDNPFVLEFYCPACRGTHIVPIGEEAGYTVLWEFNGNLDRPTITPSIKNTDHLGAVCHCYVTDGVIRFDADSTHNMAGHAMELPENY